MKLVYLRLLLLIMYDCLSVRFPKVRLCLGEGGTWVNFCWVFAAGLLEPLPHYSLFCGQLQTPILVTFGQICNFRDPNVVTLYLCIYLILNEKHFTFHIRYNHSRTFANRKYEELS